MKLWFVILFFMAITVVMGFLVSLPLLEWFTAAAAAALVVMVLLDRVIPHFFEIAYFRGFFTFVCLSVAAATLIAVTYALPLVDFLFITVATLLILGGLMKRFCSYRTFKDLKTPVHSTPSERATPSQPSVPNQSSLHICDYPTVPFEKWSKPFVIFVPEENGIVTVNVSEEASVAEFIVQYCDARSVLEGKKTPQQVYQEEFQSDDKHFSFNYSGRSFCNEMMSAEEELLVPLKSLNITEEATICHTTLSANPRPRFLTQITFEKLCSLGRSKFTTREEVASMVVAHWARLCQPGLYGDGLKATNFFSPEDNAITPMIAEYFSAMP